MSKELQSFCVNDRCAVFLWFTNSNHIMYKDYLGNITIDTVDHFPNIENYAENYGIDTEKALVKSIKIQTVRDSFIYSFICQDKKTNEEFEKEFSPNKSIFSEFFKKSEIIIKNVPQN